MSKGCVVELTALKEYLSCRDHDCEFCKTEDWLIKCKYINN
jgi:hypothetical protein